MSTELVPPPHVAWQIRLEDQDGQAAHRFTPDGRVELWLSALPFIMVDGELAPDFRRRAAFVALELDTYEQAEQAAHHLRDAVAYANRALDAARDVTRSHPKRELHDGHDHKIRLERFSRATPVSATCELCMETLTADALSLYRQLELELRYLPGEDMREMLEAWFNGHGRPRPAE